LDNRANRAFEGIGELVHLALAFLGGESVCFHLPRPHAFGFKRIVLEHHDRARHFSDLILPIGAGDLCRHVTVG
jgi:hypothetical protein